MAFALSELPFLRRKLVTYLIKRGFESREIRLCWRAGWFQDYKNKKTAESERAEISRHGGVPEGGSPSAAFTISPSLSSTKKF